MVRIRLVGPSEEVEAVAALLPPGTAVTGRSVQQNGKVVVYLKAQPKAEQGGTS